MVYHFGLFLFFNQDRKLEPYGRAKNTKPIKVFVHKHREQRKMIEIDLLASWLHPVVN